MDFGDGETAKYKINRYFTTTMENKNHVNCSRKTDFKNKSFPFACIEQLKNANEQRLRNKGWDYK